MIKIVADMHIPFLKGALEPFAKVVYLQGDKIRKSDVLDAEGLITRTRTICDSSLLEGTPVKFIATATIGFDHIDTVYCEANGIHWHHAPGCNSSSVRQYMASALARLSEIHQFPLADKTIGVIGVGHVGAKVVQLAEVLGMKPLLNDPPRAQNEGKIGFTDLDTILELADIVTLHVPLNLEGPFKTFHMADDNFFERLRKKPLLINTSRGQVTDTAAVKKALQAGRISGFTADVWENEPDIDLEMLALADIGTPHIAGYSAEGKANGTAACVRAASRFFGFGIDDWYPESLPLPANPVLRLYTTGKTDEKLLLEAINRTYDIRFDDILMRNSAEKFEEHRNLYPVRREFEAYQVELDERRNDVLQKLRALGFQTL